MENSFPKFSLYEILTISVVRFVPVLFLMCLYFARPQDGGTALLAASQYGHRQVVDTLLKHGANIHDQLYVSAFHSLGPSSFPLHADRCSLSLDARSASFKIISMSNRTLIWDIREKKYM